MDQDDFVRNKPTYILHREVFCFPHQPAPLLFVDEEFERFSRHLRSFGASTLRYASLHAAVLRQTLESAFPSAAEPSPQEMQFSYRPAERKLILFRRLGSALCTLLVLSSRRSSSPRNVTTMRARVVGQWVPLAKARRKQHLSGTFVSTPEEGIRPAGP